MMLCANYYITPSTYVIFWENVENEIFFEFGPAYLTYLTGKLFKTVAYAYLIRYLRIKKTAHMRIRVCIIRICEKCLTSELARVSRIKYIFN